MRLLLACIAATLASGCVSSHGPLRADGTEVTQADAGDRPGDVKALIQAHLRTALKDPASAQVEEIVGPAFLSVKASFLGPEAYGWATCFRVNAKNSYGGYVGFHPMVILWRDGSLIRSWGNGDLKSLDSMAADAYCNQLKHEGAPRVS